MPCLGLTRAGLLPPVLLGPVDVYSSLLVT
jgi:hypothetical protein